MPPSAIARSVSGAIVSGGCVAPVARVLAQQEQQLGRPRELRRVAEAAVRGGRTPSETARPPSSSASAPATRRFGLRPAVGAGRPTSAARAARRPRSRRARDRRVHTRASSPSRSDEARAGPTATSAGSRCRRRTASSSGVRNTRHRPAAGAGRRLHERHVDAIDVGPLLAIDLDRHEVRVEHGGDRLRSRTTRAP